jgi:hypothetical protein
MADLEWMVEELYSLNIISVDMSIGGFGNFV